MVSVEMYDLEDKKESGKCSGRSQDRGTTGNAPPACGEASSEARSLVESGQDDIGMLVQNQRGPWVRAAQLPALFCSSDLAYRCTKAGWLKPIVQGKRRTIYRLADVLTCLRRIEAGELPLPRGSKVAR